LYFVNTSLFAMFGLYVG